VTIRPKTTYLAELVRKLDNFRRRCLVKRYVPERAGSRLTAQLSLRGRAQCRSRTRCEAQQLMTRARIFTALHGPTLWPPAAYKRQAPGMPLR
jgi:hypothetical protein